MSEVTDEYLDRREELWSATTGGKWYGGNGTIHTDRGGDPVGRTGFVVWQGVRGYEPQEVLNNAEWIIDAHEAMPRIIAELRRYKAAYHAMSEQYETILNQLGATDA